MIELAALAIAGTTLGERDSVYEALRTAVSGEGPAPLEEEVRRWMGAEKREAIRALLSPGSSQAPSSATVDRVYDDFRERLLESYRRQPPRPFPGIEEALARLRSDGVRVALTTGFEREITDLEAGSNAGARAVVGVLTGGLDAATLGRVAHTHLLPRAADLPELVIEASSS
ncbi:MAG: HAD hydrolase-like protein [Thermoleophilaceae bacterium]